MRILDLVLMLSFSIGIPVRNYGHPTVCNAVPQIDRWVGEIPKEGGRCEKGNSIPCLIHTQAEKEGKVPQIDRVNGDMGQTIQKLSRVSPKAEELFLALRGLHILWGPQTLSWCVVCRSLVKDIPTTVAPWRRRLG